MRKLPGVIFLFLFFLIFPHNIYAAEIVISNLPASINIDSETTTDLFFSCSGCGDSYFRGVFYPSGTNYFGLTQNKNGDWVGTSSDRSFYFKIAKEELADASWSGKLKIKPDSGNIAFTGTGEYFFKIGRYTSAGDSSADWSNELALQIIGSTPQPTVDPTQNLTPIPTPTKSPTLVPTKSPTPKPTKTPTASPEVLGEEVTPSPEVETPTSTPLVLDSKEKKVPIIPVVLIVSGLAMIGFAILQLVNAKKSTPEV